MSKDVELILLFGLAILYVLWAAVYLHYEKWKRRKATVISASLLMMQSRSTASNGNLLSIVAAFSTFLIFFSF